MLSASARRVGAAAGTFLLPVGLAHIGVGGSMLVASGVLAVGLIISIPWAPETSGLKLADAAGGLSGPQRGENCLLVPSPDADCQVRSSCMGTFWCG
jgi:hypothetical protein